MVRCSTFPQLRRNTNRDGQTRTTTGRGTWWSQGGHIGAVPWVDSSMPGGTPLGRLPAPACEAPSKLRGLHPSTWSVVCVLSTWCNRRPPRSTTDTREGDGDAPRRPSRRTARCPEADWASELRSARCLMRCSIRRVITSVTGSGRTHSRLTPAPSASRCAGRPASASRLVRAPESVGVEGSASGAAQPDEALRPPVRGRSAMDGGRTPQRRYRCGPPFPALLPGAHAPDRRRASEGPTEGLGPFRCREQKDPVDSPRASSVAVVAGGG
jgi:hypothetical protein